MTLKIVALLALAPTLLACTTRDDDYHLLRRTNGVARARPATAGGGQRRRRVLPAPPAGRRLRRRAVAHVRDEQALRRAHDRPRGDADVARAGRARRAATRPGTAPSRSAGGGPRSPATRRSSGSTTALRARSQHDGRPGDRRSGRRSSTSSPPRRPQHRRVRCAPATSTSCRSWRRSGGRRAPSTTATSCAGCAASSRDVRGNERRAVRASAAAARADLIGDPAVVATVLYRMAASELGRRTWRTAPSIGRSWKRRRRATCTPPCCWARSGTSRPSCWRRGAAPRARTARRTIWSTWSRPTRDAYPAERAEATRIFLVTTYGATAVPGEVVRAERDARAGRVRSWRC